MSEYRIAGRRNVMPEFRMEIGQKSVQVSIPEEKVLGVLTGPDITAMPEQDIKNHISRSIVESPPRNISSAQILIIVPDHTRLWARGSIYVPVLLDSLISAGAQEQRIRVMIALGTHESMPDDKLGTLVGAETPGRVKVLNSANRDSRRLTRIGTTSHGTDFDITAEACEADHVIIFGGVLHHVIAGFGGGRKYILPGIAGYDSIQQNHSLAMLKDGSPNPRVTQAVLEGNPVHLDMTEAASLYLKERTSQLTAVAANGRGELFYVGSGDWQDTFTEGCAQVDRAGRIPITEKADFAIISAGGHEKDGQLYQSTKALFNTYNAVKDGGKILMFAECRDGVGNGEFGTCLSQYRGRVSDLGRKLNETFTMPSYVAFRVADILSRYEVTLVSGFSRADTENFGFMYTDSIESYISGLTGRGYIIPSAENILPMIK